MRIEEWRIQQTISELEEFRKVLIGFI
jgi:hypothetical protein